MNNKKAEAIVPSQEHVTPNCDIKMEGKVLNKLKELKCLLVVMRDDN